jgi:hypothetical protein
MSASVVAAFMLGVFVGALALVVLVTVVNRWRGE